MKRHLALLLPLLLCLLLMLGSDNARLAKARFLSRSLYYPFLSSLQTVRSIRQARMQNQTLHQQNAKLLLRVVDLEYRLKTLEEMNIDYLPPGRDLVVADVVGFAGNFDQRQLIINRGTRDGLMTNNAVLNTNGVVGKIVGVSPEYSTVLPLGHPQFHLGVADKRTHVQGLLETTGGNCYMTMIPIDAQVALGDTVVTSNLSTVFPKGVPVGTVRKIERHPQQPYLQALLKLFVSIGSVEQVIVLPQPEADADASLPAEY